MIRFALISIALLTQPSFAQTIGVKAGLAFATYSAVSNREANPIVPRTINNTSYRTGLTIGGNGDFRLGQKLFLRTGVEMVIKGGVEEGTYTFDGTSSPYRQTNNFVGFDIPIQLLYKTKGSRAPRFILGAGLVPSLLIESGLNRGDLGLGVLAGYELSTGVSLNLAYNEGLVDVATHSFDYKSLKNRHLALTIGYSFKQKDIAERSVFKTIRQQTTSASRPASAFYAELAGPGFLSFNYDKRLTKSFKGPGIRAGVGIIFNFNDVGFTVPVALNYLLGYKAHYLELAAGSSFYHIKETNQDAPFNFLKTSFLAPFGWFGYRYQPVERKFVFRAGFTKFIGVRMPKFLDLPHPSLSFGYSIK